MSITVTCIPFSSGLQTEQPVYPEVNLLYFTPEPAFDFYMQQRKTSEIIKCPAFSAYLKNTFIIRSPYDLTIMYDKKSKSITTNKYGQQFFDENFKFSAFGESPDVIHLPPRYLFMTNTKKSVKLITAPLILTPNKYELVPGIFSITEWIRPVEFAIEVYETTTIELKRGQPLFLVKFVSEGDENINIELGLLTKELFETALACTRVKNFVPSLNLNALYKLGSNYIQLMKKNFYGEHK